MSTAYTETKFVELKMAVLLHTLSCSYYIHWGLTINTDKLKLAIELKLNSIKIRDGSVHMSTRTPAIHYSTF